LNVPEHFQEYLLDRIGSVIGITQHPVRNVENRSVIDANEFVVCGILIRLEARHKHSFLGVKGATTFDFVKCYLSAHSNQLSPDKVA
jgi:hypothetical protein